MLVCENSVSTDVVLNSSVFEDSVVSDTVSDCRLLSSELFFCSRVLKNMITATSAAIIKSATTGMIILLLRIPDICW